MRLGAWLVLAAACVLAQPALAEDADGSYGRIEGDLLFVGEAGCAITTQGPQLETHLGLLYISTAGPYFRYVESFGDENASFDRVLAAGVELRPLFLGRYALDLAQGPPHLDLFLDSFALVIGAQWEAPLDKEIEGSPGLELGASIEVPLLPSASGPYVGLLGLARFGNGELSGASSRDFLERGSSLVFTLAWHQVFDAGLVDIRDRRREP